MNVVEIYIEADASDSDYSVWNDAKNDDWSINLNDWQSANSNKRSDKS